ncbi:hypothetical protein DAERI_020320 [Deinococcus aerius]|uniref:Uncharacterized protein n=1 Tax=Deinococcus aerius TaxID=200253 RepID=A0A2I9CSQ3_9DEIO|nr:hypothetical protein DAERI_020320 [Deinococcus aerius]
MVEQRREPSLSLGEVLVQTGELTGGLLGVLRRDVRPLPKFRGVRLRSARAMTPDPLHGINGRTAQ